MEWLRCWEEATVALNVAPEPERVLTVGRLMLNPSLALAVALWRSLAAVAALSAAISRRRWRTRISWSS